MPEADRLLGMYLHLARASGMRGQPMVRAKLLVLASVQAQRMGLAEISALCRHKILAHNPRHLVRRWPTIEEALATEPFQSHLKQLRRRYSREKVEHMMDTLGLEMGRERAAYFSDAEYAAALLDTTPAEIGEILARDPQYARKPEPVAAAGEHRRGAPSPQWRGAMLIWGPFAAGLIALGCLAVALQAWRD